MIPPIAWTPAMDRYVGTDADDKVGKFLGVSGTSVLKRRRQLGRPPAIIPRTRMRYPARVLKGAYYLELRARGMTMVAISRQEQTHQTVIRKEIKRYQKRLLEEAAEATLDA